MITGKIKAQNEMKLVDQIEIIKINLNSENIIQKTEELCIEKIDKPKNQIEYITEICIEKDDKPKNQIEFIEEFYIEKKEKESLVIDYLDYLCVLGTSDPLKNKDNSFGISSPIIVKKRNKITKIDKFIILKSETKELSIEYTDSINIIGLMNNFENLTKERLDSNYLKSNRNEIIENKNYQEISKIKQRIEYIEKNQNSLNQILEIYKELRIKEETIKELRAVLPVNIIKREKIKTNIFSSMVQKINYAIITKNTEIFANLVKNY